jgi:hypothetical protein
MINMTMHSTLVFKVFQMLKIGRTRQSRGLVAISNVLLWYWILILSLLNLQ